jgi:hypothetical protein
MGTFSLFVTKLDYGAVQNKANHTIKEWRTA